jgi:cellulose biosynthesis protein BcsQ
LGLSRFEDRLSRSWLEGFGGDPAALRATSAFHRLIQKAAEPGFDLVLIDVGPNLGAINRAALLLADYLIVPLAADMFSLQGLRNLGPTIRQGREDWHTVLNRARVPFSPPQGRMEPAGYIILQLAVRLDRPFKAYERWMAQIPGYFQTYVLGHTIPADAMRSKESPAQRSRGGESSPCLEGAPSGAGYQLGSLRNYRSLMPIAQQARRPMFDLAPPTVRSGAT